MACRQFSAIGKTTARRTRLVAEWKLRRLSGLAVFLVFCFASLTVASEEPGAILDRAEAAARKKMEELTAEGLPGALVGIVAPSGEVRRFAVGVANLETGATLRPDHTMRIGSVAKLFVATLVLQLADEGRLDLDSPISTFVPGVPRGDAITLRMLGTHGSGLFNPLANPAFRKQINADPGARRAFADIMTVLRRHEDTVVPGTSFSYSNANTVLLARVVEAVTGRSLPEVMETRIRQRFGVKSPIVPASAALPDADLRGYRFGARTGAIEYGKVFFDATHFSASWAGAAGDMNATLDDLLRLAKPLAAGSTLNEESRAVLHGFETVAPGFEYGFHIARYGAAIGHAGDVPGFSSFLAWMPHRDLSIVVLCNLSNLADKSAPATIIGTSIVDALGSPSDER